MIVITATMKARPGQGDALVAEMNRIATEVEKEAGNHCYLVHQSLEEPDTVLIYEQYADQQAVAAHRDHMTELGGGLKDLLAGRPEIQLFSLKR
ncbi:antibiotic biosynthesis monooxygenase [Alcanivorax hongdengensis A-11-3]|uniref:Antibiotic biosynthesis monooxygenase n=1 Tax=Alcanivorax hongdengensis A-11-3 TaxID=1177179 RepID=L0W9K2_9GAMM|nr:putative quinol monooxygenase [Alcanivorax hongdengensis]EKF73641.1 antibiotic biosynthesis monooxygenase [Alcanivorax hongdengensis A-11-3]